MTAAKIIRYGVAAANGGHRRSFDVMGVTIYVEPHEDDAHAERIAEELAASGAVVARMLEAESHAHRLAAENDRLKMQLKAAQHPPPPARLLGRGCVRFDTDGQLWMMNRAETGWASFGLCIGSWDELFRRFDAVVVEAKQDATGWYWVIESSRANAARRSEGGAG